MPILRASRSALKKKGQSAMRKNIFQYMYIPLPGPAERMKEHGKLTEAAAYLQHLIESEACLPEEKKRFFAEQEILRRLPGEYPYTREEALGLLRRYIPDFSEERFDALLAEGKIFWRYLDGSPHYFGRFFDSLCKTEPYFSEEAAKRGYSAVGSDVELLRESAEKMQRVGKLSVRLLVRAELKLEQHLYREGALLWASLPFPRDTEEQSDIQLKEFCAGGQIGAADAEQRVVFWEERMRENHAFSLQYSLLHTESYRDLYTPAEELEAGKGAEIEEAGLPRSTGTYIRLLAERLTEGVKEPLSKAKRFYDFITKRVRYSFMPSYFCLDRMAERCASDRVGDCGIQALLFLSLCEAAGIPAHWESGLKTEPGFIGAHDWVRFYTGEYGWRAADLSYGGAAWRRGDRRMHRFYFGNVDPWRAAANVCFMGETGFPEPEFRADPYDNQVGEMALDGQGLRYEDFTREKEIIAADEEKEG